MEDAPSRCCCRKEPGWTGQKTRRGFFGYAAGIVGGAIALLIPSVTGLAAFLNPLRQKSQSGQFRRLASLDTLSEDGTPRKTPIIADRVDAWNIFPSEPVGAVFLSRQGDSATALQVICPHAGCSINFEGSVESGKYFCPCHAASFDLDGKRIDVTSPSPRDMDSLEVEIRNENEVWVKYETFRLGIAQKVAQG